MRADAARSRSHATALAETDIQPPVVDLVANVTAAPTRDPETIRALLVAQVCGAVRWRECMGYMHSHGVDLFVEIGAGKVLAGLVKRTAEGATGAQCRRSGRRPIL